MGAEQAFTCPDENLLVSLIEGRLGDGAVRALESHIDACASCESFFGELAAVIAPAPDPSTLPANDVTIGRYQILGEVGAGAMGVIYAALDVTLGRKVALKLLRPDLAGSAHLASARARLLREARLLAGLSHPNVLTVYEAGVSGDQVFIAVELIDGSSLAAWQDEAPRNVGEILLAYTQAARGLAAAHEAGLVHRDVKPANLMLGNDGRLRVTDFGLATATSSTGLASGRRPSSRADTALRTESGAIVGTPAYMAPEQFAGRKVDARSDQFSFCVALGEALTGERPLAGATSEDLEESLAKDRQPVPRGLLDLVARGLRSRPVERWPSMTEIAVALDRILSTDESVPASVPLRVVTTPPPDISRERTPRGSRPRAWAAIGVAVAVGGVVAIGLAVRSELHPKSLDVVARSNGAPAITATGAVSDPVRPSGDPNATASSIPEGTSAPSATTSPMTSTSPSPSVRALVASASASSVSASLAPADNIDLAITVERAHDNGDAAGCLTAMANVAAVDPTLAARPDLQIDKAQCLQLSGDCASGRKVLGALLAGKYKGAELESAIDASSLNQCKARAASPVGGDDSERKRAAIGSLITEVTAARSAHDTKKCRSIGDQANDLVAREKLVSEPALKPLAASVLMTVAMCLADAGDAASCKAADAQFARHYKTLYPELVARGVDDAALEKMFHQSFPTCP